MEEFMSPAANKRTDKYGGNTKKRALIVREILQQTREKLGKDFILRSPNECGIQKLEQVEAALKNDMADMVAIGRALITDPTLVTKSLQNRVDEVVECTDCMQGFMPGSEPGIKCLTNDNI